MTDPDSVPAVQRRFNELYRCHARAVFRSAVKAFGGDHERAEDILQEVFLAVWEQYDRDFLYLEVHEAAPLIMTITKRRVVDAWRRSDGVVTVGDYFDGAVPMTGVSMAGNTNPAERVLTDDALEYLWLVLRQNLTQTEYRVAVMAWDMCLPDIDIAKVIGASVSTVQSHKSRARRKIRAIENVGEFHIEFGPWGRSPHTPRTGASNGGEVTA
ncbi:RNA polymerase sigma factor [Nocardia abscessus]|uniref:RNA polymerase sigma factor n=1 Tax=Nocardia abscessus TaxID=120957 RepID=UPI000A019B99|nr:sigma-70 family RNA polymerase sigma factor [Nocardia abscessus]MCC3328351.1 sigma-70 family RNA polymerase sigma factor [Nocardia abscessus]